MTKHLDLLAVGAHPDDVEIGMGGTIARHIQAGLDVGICDMTEAELSSNGTVEKRREEANKASTILSLSLRKNLQFPDRGLGNNEELIAALVDLIRQYQPRVVFAPFYIDRHPDHGHCGEAVKEAVFSAGIRKFRGRKDLAAHKVEAFHYYFINGFHEPDFLVDITDYQTVKMDALKAYKSQFEKTDEAIETPLTNGYLETVESRDRLFGKEGGTVYAEGFKTTKPLLVKQLIGG